MMKEVNITLSLEEALFILQSLDTASTFRSLRIRMLKDMDAPDGIMEDEKRIKEEVSYKAVELSEKILNEVCHDKDFEMIRRMCITRDNVFDNAYSEHADDDYEM